MFRGAFLIPSLVVRALSPFSAARCLARFYFSANGPRGTFLFLSSFSPSSLPSLFRNFRGRSVSSGGAARRVVWSLFCGFEIEGPRARRVRKIAILLPPMANEKLHATLIRERARARSYWLRHRRIPSFLFLSGHQIAGLARNCLLSLYPTAAVNSVANWLEKCNVLLIAPPCWLYGRGDLGRWYDSVYLIRRNSSAVRYQSECTSIKNIYAFFQYA